MGFKNLVDNFFWLFPLIETIWRLMTVLIVMVVIEHVNDGINSMVFWFLLITGLIYMIYPVWKSLKMLLKKR